MVMRLNQCLRRLYGDWFTGFSETLSSDALALTAASVRPIVLAMRPVGVLPFASFASCAKSADVQAAPWFLGVFAILPLN